MIFVEVQFFKNKKLFIKKTTKNIFQRLKEQLKVFVTILKYHKNIFVSGFYIMLGTVLFTLFFNTGRWITKILTTDEMFAIYSLSLSLIGFIVIFVSALNKTFYPYLHRNNNIEVIDKLRRILYITSSISLPAFFILKFIITKYLIKYTDALPVTAVIMASIPGIFIIKSIYANLYKVQKKEQKFLTDTIIYLMIGFVLNISSFLIFHTLISIAVASVVTIYIWTFFPLTFKILSPLKRIYEITYILLILGSFYAFFRLDLHFLLNAILSFIIIIGINLIFFKRSVFSLLKRRL